MAKGAIEGQRKTSTSPNDSADVSASSAATPNALQLTWWKIANEISHVIGAFLEEEMQIQTVFD